MQNEKSGTKKYDLKVEKTIARPAAEVFRAIGEGRLFLNCGANNQRMKIDFKVGGKYELEFVAYGLSNHGEFLEILPNRKIVFTWCQDAQATSKPDTTVTIELKEDGGKTHLRVLHEGFSDQDKANSHQGGWNGGLEDMGNEITLGKLRFNRYFEVPIQKLYDKCKDPVSFFGMLGDAEKGNVDFQVGGRYQVPTEKGEVKGKFLEIIPGKKIVFSWESAPCGEKLTHDTKVTLNFELEDDNSSWLELIHEGLDTESQQKAHSEGWDWMLTKMLG